MKREELVLRAKLYCQAGDAITRIGIGKVAQDSKLRHIATAGAVGTTVTGSALLLGATGVVVKLALLASIGAITGSFVAGVKQGMREMEAIQSVS